jgi:uncharacterized protein (TIGR03067 family)
MNPKTFLTASLTAVVALFLSSMSAAETETAKKDLAQLQGKWAMVSGGAGGEFVNSVIVTNSYRVCDGNQTTVVVGGQLLMKANFTLDASTTPKSINYQVTAGPNTGKSQLGIYELEGDILRFCFAAPGNARPTDFITKPGDGRTSSVWNREIKPTKN